MQESKPVMPSINRGMKHTTIIDKSSSTKSIKQTTTGMDN
jgi:hypothetical protein